jgi:hypothetical protein
MIAQVMIELGERLGKVAVTAAVDNIDVFSGMGMKKPQPIFLSARNCSYCRVSIARDQEGENKQTH